ncbi:MAG: molybdate ABC transporter substrate-binding protein [Gammaproteobacteria bacterium]|nr:molybdate ABC transporter substrate-binding protein [Gammaproteobacteria bacterium]
MQLNKTLLLLLLLIIAPQTRAAEIRVAVASNFATTMRLLAEQFEASTDHRVTLIYGSTGKHYAQIKNGAPFDIFFAADTRRPELLEIEGNVVIGSRFTYAQGKLVLWSPQADYVDSDAQILASDQFSHLAIANPRLAPYGVAAKQVLESRGLWHKLKSRIVRGENIGQAFQFVKSGNVPLGFVAYSQILQSGVAVQGSIWQVPQELYTPIEQQMVMLQDNDATRAFLAFVRSDRARAIIRSHGYQTP